MEEETSLIVTRIKNGTVIDHIDGGKGLHVLEALEIDGKEGDVITIAPVSYTHLTLPTTPYV